MSNKYNSYKLIGLLEGLTLIFAAGKIFGYIDWSWWLVFLPTLLPFYILGVFVFFYIIHIIIKAISEGIGRI